MASGKSACVAGLLTMALVVMGWSPVLGLSVVPAPQPQQIEDRFLAGALALVPVSLEDAADAVRRLGVARVDGMVDPSLAAALKQRTLDEMLGRSDRWVKPDKRMVAGTLQKWLRLPPGLCVPGPHELPHQLGAAGSALEAQALAGRYRRYAPF